ncbi:pif1 [Symbiodinium natans]|uniref:Pif1 protein n=1 Tax=Symbiodinium natans TaxID=878477 RepID=A0A812PHI7_9DINO|nr:pif1 [Symbiodinium natans]
MTFPFVDIYFEAWAASCLPDIFAPDCPGELQSQSPSRSHDAEEDRDGKKDHINWTARPMPGMPENIWFKQQKEVPSASPQESASKMPPWYGSHVEFCNRAGGPGAGRTEVVVAATDKALRSSERKNAPYVSPSRLLHFGLIIFDEISQIEAAVWAKLKVALGELQPALADEIPSQVALDLI